MTSDHKPDTINAQPTSDDHTEAVDMTLSPSRAAALRSNLSSIISKVTSATPSSRASSRPPRLIAISKLHPAASISALHEAGQVHFGENYIQELQQKAAVLPQTIKWTFCGNLQSNKARQLAESVPSLWNVSSVDSAKKADALDKGRANLLGKEPAKEGSSEEKLKVMIQINTSSEEQKGGVSPGTDAVELARHIATSCPHLQLQGVMTIGSFLNSHSGTEAAASEETNPDFSKLIETRDLLAKELGLEKDQLDLSMGMSADFELALRMGSDEVRVGTSIFGERPPKSEATV
jgi:pyridoxal phosphate enzyme (YggS family)